MQENIKKITKISAFAGVAMTGLLLSGCSLDDVTKTVNTEEVVETFASTEAPTLETTEAPTLETTEAPTPEATEAPTPEAKQNAEVRDGEISDEAFEKAFAKYLKENPIQFGKQVDEAYGIYQQEAQKEQKEAQAKLEAERKELIKNIRDITDADHIEGNKDAQFVLFEYSDYHCPFCKRFNVTTKEFLAKNEDVAIVFRAYPAVHKTTAQPIHEAAECIARESGNEAFWKFSDEVFKSQFKAKDIKAKLSELKIANAEKIMKCYEDGDFKTLVDESAQEAVSLGINGTPGSILKNTKTGEVLFINGAQPLNALESARKQLLEVQ